MLLRLLLVVLMLAGPVPVRLCNCAVSAAPPASSVQFPATPPAHTKSCSCGHRAKSTALPAANSETPHAEGCESLKADLPVQGGHDSDCPATKPRASISDAVVTPATDAPAEGGLVSVVDEAPANVAERPCAATLASQAPLSVPLFIAFLSLRN